MSMSSEDKAEGDTSKGMYHLAEAGVRVVTKFLLAEEAVSKKGDLAKDPLGLGLGESAEKPKGKRITEANTEYGRCSVFPYLRIRISTDGMTSWEGSRGTKVRDRGW